MSKIIGIDLGTTNSVVAVMEGSEASVSIGVRTDFTPVSDSIELCIFNRRGRPTGGRNNRAMRCPG